MVKVSKQCTIATCMQAKLNFNHIFHRYFASQLVSLHSASWHDCYPVGV